MGSFGMQTILLRLHNRAVCLRCSSTQETARNYHGKEVRMEMIKDI